MLRFSDSVRVHLPGKPYSTLYILDLVRDGFRFAVLDGMEVELPPEEASQIASGLSMAADRADKFQSDVDKSVSAYGPPNGQSISISVPDQGRVELYLSDGISHDTEELNSAFARKIACEIDRMVADMKATHSQRG